MNYRFFKPFVGARYKDGIQGKRVLVLGASFYCLKEQCEFFRQCTDTEKKDSSEFDEKCPYNNGNPLHDEPTNAGGLAYGVFEKFIRQYVDDEDDVWQHLAFTNYLQFFSPTIITKRQYLSDRDFEALCETLKEIKPDVVITWGIAMLDDVQTNNPYVIDKDDLPKSKGYVCHMRYPDNDHIITIVSAYHPSAWRYWNNNLDDLKKYFEFALAENADAE